MLKATKLLKKLEIKQMKFRDGDLNLIIYKISQTLVSIIM